MSVCVCVYVCVVCASWMYGESFLCVLCTHVYASVSCIERARARVCMRAYMRACVGYVYSVDCRRIIYKMFFFFSLSV